MAQEIMEVQGNANAVVSLLGAAREIADDTDYVLVADLLKTGRAVIKEIEAVFDPIVAAAHKAHKEATAQRKKLIDPVQAGCNHVKSLMDSYTRAQMERARREQQEAERKAKEEAEARAIAEAERYEAEAAAAKAAGDEALARSQTMRANECLDNVIVPAVHVAPAMPKTAGVTARAVWKWRVVDFAQVPDRYKVTNDTLIGDTVRSLKSGHGITGIEAYEDFVTVLR